MTCSWPQVARGGGVADALIEACRQECGRRGAVATHMDNGAGNLRAQKVYDRVGGHREQWVDYWLKA